MAEMAQRRPVLSGRHTGAGGAAIAVLPPATRLSLRAPQESVGALSAALGVELPTRPKRFASAGSRHVAWLGPDEWIVIDEGTLDPLEACRSVQALHSAVDISHRNIAFAVSGPGAEDVLSAGCPQDLSPAAFPAGAASRTLFGKVEVVLLRTAPDTFRVECWRSFGDYVFTLLSEAARSQG